MLCKMTSRSAFSFALRAVDRQLVHDAQNANLQAGESLILLKLALTAVHGPGFFKGFFLFHKVFIKIYKL